MRKLIKDLKEKDICYEVFDNGILYEIECVSCALINEYHNWYKMVFRTVNGVIDFIHIHDGNEDYICTDDTDIYINKEDAIDKLEKMIRRCDNGIKYLTENDK